VQPSSSAPANYDAYFGIRNGDVDHNFYVLQVSGTNNLECRFRNDAGPSWTINESSAVTGGTWVHVVMTYDGDTLTTYLDGDFASQNTNATGAFSSSAYPLRMGSDGQGNVLDGIVDEMRASNTARSADWIRTEYNNQSDTAVGAGKFFKSLGSEENDPNAITLADHAEGQEPDRLNGNVTQTGVEVFAFQLANIIDATKTLNGLVFQLSSVNGMLQGDFDNFYVYVDADGSGDIEGGETTKVCAAEATTNISGATGTITFSGCGYDISAGATVKMVLTGDLANLAPGDSFTIDLGADDLTLAAGGTAGSDATTTTHAVDIATGYQFRKKITIDKDELDGDCATDLENLANFPLLVTLTGSDFADVAANTGYEGYDIIFKDADGNLLDHEIEEYDETTNKRLVAWVRVPTIYYDRDTVIWMYYGNPSVTAPTENPEGVWDDNFKGVWHMNEATDATVVDSTQYSNDAAPYGSPAASSAGKFAGALDFTDTNDYVDVGTCGITENHTLEGWIYPQTLSTTNETYLRLGGGGDSIIRHEGLVSQRQAHYYIKTADVLRHLREASALRR